MIQKPDVAAIDGIGPANSLRRYSSDSTASEIIEAELNAMPLPAVPKEGGPLASSWCMAAKLSS
jgi:hypothetical protein